MGLLAGKCEESGILDVLQSAAGAQQVRGNLMSDPNRRQCDGCETGAEQPHAPCWAVFSASGTPGKDENHGGDRSDRR